MKKFLLFILLLPIYICHGAGHNPEQAALLARLAHNVLRSAQIDTELEHNNFLFNQQRREKVARKKANGLKHKEPLRKQKSETIHQPKNTSNNSDFKKPHR